MTVFSGFQVKRYCLGLDVGDPNCWGVNLDMQGLRGSKRVQFRRQSFPIRSSIGKSQIFLSGETKVNAISMLWSQFFSRWDPSYPWTFSCTDPKHWFMNDVAIEWTCAFSASLKPTFEPNLKHQANSAHKLFPHVMCPCFLGWPQKYFIPAKKRCPNNIIQLIHD